RDGTGKRLGSGREGDLGSGLASAAQGAGAAALVLAKCGGVHEIKRQKCIGQHNFRAELASRQKRFLTRLDRGRVRAACNDIATSIMPEDRQPTARGAMRMSDPDFA